MVGITHWETLIFLFVPIEKLYTGKHGRAEYLPPPNSIFHVLFKPKLSLSAMNAEIYLIPSPGVAIFETVSDFSITPAGPCFLLAIKLRYCRYRKSPSLNLILMYDYGFLFYCSIIVLYMSLACIENHSLSKFLFESSEKRW